MGKKNKEITSANDKLLNATEAWISSHTKLILIVAIFIVFIALVAVVGTSIIKNNSAKASEKLANLESSYNEFLVMDADSENYSALEESVLNAANDLYKNSGVKKYDGAKAALILASISYEKADYQNAISLYDEVAKAQSKTYLGEVALISEAVAYEESGDNTKALELYNKIFDDYGTSGIYSSRALFNAARLTEESNIELAISMYEQLYSDFVDYGSEYAKLAKTRASQLKSN